MAIPFHVKNGMEREATAKRDFVFHQTADFSPSIRKTGSVYTNLGASSGVTFTLPTNSSGEKGITYTFVVMAAQNLTIDPGSSGAFYIGGAKQSDDENVVSSSIGDAITVVSDGNGDWIVTDRHGSWNQSTVNDGAVEFSGSVDFSGTRTDPECVSPTADLSLTSSGYGGKTVLATSLCRKLTLPLASASLDGLEFTIVNAYAVGSASLELWVDPTSGDKVNLGTTGVGIRLQQTADAVGDCVTVKCDGSNWYTIAQIGTWAASSVG